MFCILRNNISYHCYRYRCFKGRVTWIREGESEKALSMEVNDLKWYSPFLFLLGAILSFADQITDILTLVEFYHTDHKT